MKTLTRACLALFAIATIARAETHLYIAKQENGSTLPPIQATVPAGERVVLTFPILSGNLWLKDSVPIADEAEREFIIESAKPGDSGIYRVLYLTDELMSSQEVAINVVASVTAPPAPPSPSFLIFTARALASTGPQALVSGFVIDEVPGNPVATRKILIRAIGPSLVDSGFADAMTQPLLSVYDQFGQPFYSQSLTAAQLTEVEESCGAAPMKAGRRDVWMYLHLRPGAYAAYVASGTGIPGRVLLEIYATP